MESLKRFAEICEPDERQKCFALIDPNSPGGPRPMTLRDFYDDAESIQLHEGVPEEIRSHFKTARNLIIYSWFYYPLNVTAELCAYASVEFALRIKDGKKTKRSLGLAELLEKAVKKKWIRDDAFSHIKDRYDGFLEYNESLPPQWRQEMPPLDQEYCKVLTKTLPSLRNTLAHGDSFLSPSGAFTVRICADLINQLFENPKAATGE